LIIIKKNYTFAMRLIYIIRSAVVFSAGLIVSLPFEFFLESEILGVNYAIFL
jgi:hypothetical protein